MRIALFDNEDQYKSFDARNEESKQGEAFRKVAVKVKKTGNLVYEFKDVPPAPMPLRPSMTKTETSNLGRASLDYRTNPTDSLATLEALSEHRNSKTRSSSLTNPTVAFPSRSSSSQRDGLLNVVFSLRQFLPACPGRVPKASRYNQKSRNGNVVLYFRQVD